MMNNREPYKKNTKWEGGGMDFAHFGILLNITFMIIKFKFKN
jgi:hypothetical protein